MATMTVNPAPNPDWTAAVVAAGGSVFIDTNVLVYATAPNAPDHDAARAAVDDILGAKLDAWISRQVIREYLSTMTRPQSYAPTPGPLGGVLANANAFQNDFRVAESGPRVTAQLFDLLAAVPCHGKKVHDANVVATMLVWRIPTLLTHNVADFVRFRAYITVIPLVPTTPSAGPGVP